MSLIDRVGAFGFALVELALYVIVVFLGIALFTRPHETAELLFGPRGLKIATTVLRPFSAAMNRSAWGRRTFAVTHDVSRRVDVVVEKILGHR